MCHCDGERGILHFRRTGGDFLYIFYTRGDDNSIITAHGEAILQCFFEQHQCKERSSNAELRYLGLGT